MHRERHRADREQREDLALFHKTKPCILQKRLIAFRSDTLVDDLHDMSACGVAMVHGAYRDQFIGADTSGSHYS
jgi:hypothetical protein